ncbi:MAG: hypothetical protein K2Q22_14220 [Cytophagales bacterium]|nr:hypothetical protein [Cytophagales bacterium]
MGQNLRIVFLIIILNSSLSVAFAQYTDLDKYKTFNRIEKQLIKTRIAFDTPDSSVYAHVMEYDAKVHPDESKFYYWFKAGQIKKSRGGFDGRLLHGQYTVFLFNKNLKEKGNFAKGLKSGQWLTWHPNGELKVSANWSRGYLTGKYATWDANGKLLSKGFYLKDKKNGKWAFYQPDGTVEFKKYKKDVEVKKVKSTPIWSNIFKKKTTADTLAKPTKSIPPKAKPIAKDTSKQSKQVPLIKSPLKSTAKDSTSKKKPIQLLKKDAPKESGSK